MENNGNLKSLALIAWLQVKTAPCANHCCCCGTLRLDGRKIKARKMKMQRERERERERENKGETNIEKRRKLFY